MELIKTEIVVIGAGPGGYTAAFYAADKGKTADAKKILNRAKRLFPADGNLKQLEEYIKKK